MRCSEIKKELSETSTEQLQVGISHFGNQKDQRILSLCHLTTVLKCCSTVLTNDQTFVRPFYKIQTSSELDLTLCLHHRQRYTNDTVMSIEKHETQDFW